MRKELLRVVTIIVGFVIMFGGCNVNQNDGIVQTDSNDVELFNIVDQTIPDIVSCMTFYQLHNDLCREIVSRNETIEELEGNVERYMVRLQNMFDIPMPLIMTSLPDIVYADKATLHNYVMNELALSTNMTQTFMAELIMILEEGLSGENVLAVLESLAMQVDVIGTDWDKMIIGVAWGSAAMNADEFGIIQGSDWIVWFLDIAGGLGGTMGGGPVGGAIGATLCSAAGEIIEHYTGW